MVSVSAGYNLGAVGTRVSFDGGGSAIQFCAVDLQGNHPFVFQTARRNGRYAGEQLRGPYDRLERHGQMTKLGAGMLRLDGSGNAFSGTVVVEEGTLQLCFQSSSGRLPRDRHWRRRRARPYAPSPAAIAWALPATKGSAARA